MQILFGKLWNAQKLIDVLLSFVSTFSLRLWYFSKNFHCLTLPQYSYHPHFWTHMVSSMHVPIERKMKENLTWNISVYYSFLFHYYCNFFSTWIIERCYAKVKRLSYSLDVTAQHATVQYFYLKLLIEMKEKQIPLPFEWFGSAVLSTFFKWHWFDEISSVKIFTSLIQRTFTERNRINYQSIYTMMKFCEKQHPNAYVENYMKFNSIWSKGNNL